MVFVIHWHESAMDIYVFPIPIPPLTSLSTRSLWVFPVHQVWALVSCIQLGLVICFTLDNIHVSYITTGKTIALTRWTFVSKVMSLLFNMLSTLVITSLAKSKHLLISCLQSLSAVILEPPKNKVCHCFHCFPISLPWSDGTGCHNLSFLNVEF